MKPFSKISSRLWLTYVFLVIFVLLSALTGIIVAFWNSPLLYWKEYVRLNYVTNSLSNRLDFYPDGRWGTITEVFLSEPELQEVRVIIVGQDGSTILDTFGSQDTLLPAIDNPISAYERTEGSIRVFRGAANQNWFYQISPINDENYLIVAIPKPTFQIRSIFQDELFNPLFKVGLIAFLVAFVVSWIVARWITQPLKNISDSAEQLAVGDFPPIPLQGPQEVQQLASVINKMDQKVRSGIQSQKDFVANVSHEFKTPLTSIQGFAQAILDDALDTQEEKQYAANVILDETQRLNYLVNDLLTLAKLEAGTINLEKYTLNLNLLIDRVIERFRFSLEEKNIDIQLISDEKAIIYADGERILQVLNNLLDNAIKFTPTNGKIEIIIEVSESYVVASIKDTGIGIPEKDLQFIFDRFFQVDKSRSDRAKKSVGLGLSIARQIILAHGGDISVTSELGKGSCFMVKLPLAHEIE